MDTRDSTQARSLLVECYSNLEKVLRDHRDELAPFEERNALKAVGALWQIVNGLEVAPYQLYDVGA